MVKLDQLLCLLYNLYMVQESRKLIALRILPSVHRKAKIAAVIADRTLGRWLEEAILEKIERGDKDGG